MNQIYSPQQKNDMNMARSSLMGQMRFGALQAKKPHPMLSFFLKLSGILNAAGWGVLWCMFRIKDLFPPHDAPFMSAIGWFFIFGAICAICGVFVFNHARTVEAQAITRALTQNRRYEWHANYKTEEMGAEELNKVAESRQNNVAAAQIKDAGGNYFRMTGFLAMAALLIWFVGLRMVFTTLL